MVLREIVEEVPVFKSIEKKEKFLIVLSALSLRLISLSKATEIMNMSTQTLLEFLDALGVSFSYLEEEDVDLERTW